jgi:hypothetical protein
MAVLLLPVAETEERNAKVVVHPGKNRACTLDWQVTLTGAIASKGGNAQTTCL